MSVSLGSGRVTFALPWHNQSAQANRRSRSGSASFHAVVVVRSLCVSFRLLVDTYFFPVWFRLRAALTHIWRAVRVRVTLFFGSCQRCCGASDLNHRPANFVSAHRIFNCEPHTRKHTLAHSHTGIHVRDLFRIYIFVPNVCVNIVLIPWTIICRHSFVIHLECLRPTRQQDRSTYRIAYYNAHTHTYQPNVCAITVDRI